jgi:hypothetical protein
MRTVALCLLILAVSSAAAGPVTASPDRCSTTAAVTFRSPRIEVWATERPSICHRPTGKVTTPANEPPIAGFDRDRPRAARQSTDAAGDYIGYAWESPEDECGYSGITLVNARTGAVGAPQAYRCGFFTRFRRVVVKATGAIAWSERHSIVACRTGCDADGATHVVLASASGVDTRSLRDAPRGVRWRQSGRSRFAPLP